MKKLFAAILVLVFALPLPAAERSAPIKPKAAGTAASERQGSAQGPRELQADLANLKKLEDDDTGQKEKEQAEIAEREKELAALDAEIAAMRSRLGTSAAGQNDSVGKMAALIGKKEADAKTIDELRRQHEAERAKRRADIDKLHKQVEEKRRTEVEKDIANFEKTSNSPRGKVEIPAAWKRLTAKYASVEGIGDLEVGNVRALRLTLLDPLEFISVKGGCFEMGDAFGDGGSDEQPVHQVCVDDYSIGKYEVTQAQWEAVMGNNPSRFKQCGGNCPVEQVSWKDIQEFIRTLNKMTGRSYRLPTEAEWEYAARSGGRSEKYAGGNDPDSVAWYSANSAAQPHPVGAKRPNGLGIHDMSGNVWEWCQDWHAKRYNPNAPNSNPRGPASGNYRVLRGGSCRDYPRQTRATARNWGFPNVRYDSYGFRLVRPR
jgi:formylglycine-generating enzyme required for sulfatase activity